jgi:RNA polymerase sigma-70 factor, ECF subfamily
LKIPPNWAGSPITGPGSPSTPLLTTFLSAKLDVRCKKPPIAGDYTGARAIVADEYLKMTDWSQIVQQHGPMVWRTAHRLVNNETDASDCFQWAFVSALKLEGTQAVRNWPALLKRLVIARALECLRRQHRESNRRSALAEAAVIDRKTVGPLQAAQATELAQHLREALAELDGQQAQVFCLACLEGFSYQEIAEQLGVTVNHVGVLLHRARSSLQGRLRAYGPAAAPRQAPEGQP